MNYLPYVYRSFNARESKTKDGDGFYRYNLELKVNGEWVYVSSLALDEETLYREADEFINRFMHASQK